MASRFHHDMGGPWALPAMLILPLAYTYLVSALTVTTPPLGTLPSPPNPEQVDQARRRHIQQHELEVRQRRISRKPFPFLRLPPEIRLLILERCAEWPGTFSSLVRVSKHIQALTYTSCLPHLPIRLIDPHQVDSFELFLDQRPSLAGAVRHLWITPLHESYIPIATRLLKRCTNLHSLACTGRMLQDGVTCAFCNYKLHHTQIRELTLLYTDDTGWASLVRSPSVIQFFTQLTHLRLVGDRVPSAIAFPNLQQISYAFNPHDSTSSFALGTELLQNKESSTSSEGALCAYPALQSVVLVRERKHSGSSVRIWRKPHADERRDVGRNVFVFEIPAQRTELDLWCDNALGRGFWQLCRGT